METEDRAFYLSIIILALLIGLEALCIFTGTEMDIEGIILMVLTAIVGYFYPKDQ